VPTRILTAMCPAVADFSRPELDDSVKALAESMTLRQFRCFVAAWLVANYADVGEGAAVVCPTATGGDAVIPIPLTP
jgi:hypothetical protein